MPSTTSKRPTKRTPASSTPTKPAKKRAIKVVRVYPAKGTMTGEEFDAIAISHGARRMTPAERQEFRRFIKDPYP